jgi:hypothetical protein
MKARITMETHVRGRRRGWLSIATGLGAVLAVGLTAACGPGPATGSGTVAAPTTATPIEGAGQAVDATGEPVEVAGLPAATSVANPGSTVAPPAPAPGPTLVPVPEYQIVVKVNTPSTTHPCYPAGSIEVYGSGFPVTVTHEWRYRSVLVGAGVGTQLGPAVVHGYNVPGGKAISSEKLPAGNWQVQLRVTSPKLVVTDWVTHNPCELGITNGGLRANAG